MFGNKLIQDITKSDIIEFLQGYQVRDKLAICFEIFAIIRQVFRYCVSYDL